MRTLLISLCILSSIHAFPQKKDYSTKGKNYEALEGVLLDVKRVTYKGKVDDEFFGLKTECQEFNVIRRGKLQVGRSHPPKFRKRSVKFSLYVFDDSLNVLKDTILKEIGKYMLEAKEWEEKHDAPEGESFGLMILEKSTGVYNNGENYVPCIRSNHSRNGAYYIYLYKNKVYKLFLSGMISKGFGELSSLYGCVAFKFDDKTVILKSYIKTYDQFLELYKKGKF